MLVPRMVFRHGRRDDIVAPPLARRRAKVALPAGGYPPPVTQELVDALIAAATGLDQPASR